MEIQGYIVEYYRKYFDESRQDDPPIYWERFSSKVYKTKEIAESAFKDSPYRIFKGHWERIGRVIPIYREDNENNFYYL